MELVEMVRATIEKRMSEAPPEVREKLDILRVSLVRSPGKIEVSFAPDDTDADQFKEGFLDALLVPLSQAVNMFGCRVELDVRND